ncbi:hypothetical protein EUGRSUZ_G02131 [Eucalyptus grandis]|uniref:Uncharacterized protein n=2 Tax=Eucalyptus grandis TaxID=71139 RepID=A0ACC3K5Z4_EUCGR|nr:hypothetical protein EUGRSUZ_G02131 [Eucalyptus grandis]
MASAPAFAPLILWTLLVFQSFEFGHSEAFTNVSCFGTEREALLKFRQGLIDHSKRLSSWTSKDCCEWKGVECSKKTGHVFKLDLRNPCLETDIYGDIIGSDQSSLADCYVGPKFPLWLQTQRNISYLRMANARISDELPNWLSDILLNVEHIDLTNNTLKGPISRMDLNKMPLLGLLGLADNNLSGSIPNSLWAMENLYLLDLARNQLSGTIPSLSPISRMDGNKMPRLIYFYLQDNNLSGSIPNSLCAMENLIQLDLSKNQLSGRLPLCLKKLKALEMILVGDNRLRGQITNYFCHFKQLAVLNLHKNGFDKVLPKCLSNLTELVLLDLSDNDFTGEIPPFGRRFKRLSIINLESNSLTGGIPTQLCQLDFLRVLSLARNNISGSIPLCFNGLLSMVEGIDIDRTDSLWLNPTIIYVMVHAKGTSRLYDKTLHFFHSIDLSANNLNGEIPKELTRLVQLQNLNLSQNNLSGKIPSNIGNLKNLESLDLSNNGISGRIPPSISSLDFLSCLNLSFNNLSGPIPSSSHLRTVDDESVYRGNDGLCGAPLSKVCPRDGDFQNGGEPNEGNLDIHNWFYAGLGPGFAVGFLGFCSALHFKQSWRISYFQAIDKIIEKLMILGMITTLQFKRAFQVKFDYVYDMLQES